MRKITAILAVLVFYAWSAGAANGEKCSERGDLVDMCFVVHGRLFLSNGTPEVRIWKVGTKRLLGVIGGETPEVPPAIAPLIDFQTNLYADFTVCPLSKERAGEMQIVCVAELKSLVVEKLDEHRRPALAYRVPDESR